LTLALPGGALTNFPCKLRLKIFLRPGAHCTPWLRLCQPAKPPNRRMLNCQYVQKSSATAEIARVGGNYAVQGHSRSPILTSIESPYATSC